MIDKSDPAISIITAVLNCRRSIEFTIRSILPQLSNKVEYIIIDGGSTDGTLDILKKYSDSIDYIVSEPDLGIYDAWNKGIKVSKGNYVAFVGADDVLRGDIIAKYLSFINNSPNIDYVSSKAQFDGENSRIFGKEWKWDSFRRYMTVAHVGSLHRRSLYSQYGFYDTSYKIVGDYEFLLRVGRRLSVGFIDCVGVTMGANGVSNKLIHLSLKETLRAKVSTAACNVWIARFDYFVAYMKFFIRQFFINLR
jgi:glycosyltransferase involved in cell wall biosynthesis